MGSAASRTRGVPDPTERPGPVPDQNWDALERLKHSRGAMWTDEMASIVEHNLRHNWDLAPRPGENRCMWDIRVDATYDYYYTGMAQWLNKPLQAAQGSGQGQQEHNPPNSEKPPEERDSTSPRNAQETTTEEAWDTRTGARSGPAHRPRSGGQAYRRTRTDELTNGTATHGSRGGPRGPRMVQGAQETPSPATRGPPTRRARTTPSEPSSQAGEVSTGRAHRARRMSRTQCDSRDGGAHHGSNFGGKGSPTRRCASRIGVVVTRLHATSGTSLTGTPASSATRPRWTPSGSSHKTHVWPPALV